MTLEDAVPPQVRLDPTAKSKMLAALLTEARKSADAPLPPPDPGVRRIPGWRRRPRRRALVGLATAGILAVALLLASAFVDDAPRPAAASSLQRAASALSGDEVAVGATGSLGLRSLPPGQFEYTRVESADVLVTGATDGRPGVTYLEPEDVQRWRATDGSGVEKVHVEPPVFQTPSDRSLAQGQGPLPMRDQVFALPAGDGPDDPTWTYMSSLPTRPDALLDRLQVDSDEDLTPARTFSLVVDVLGAGPPPDLQVALYRLVAALPGVREESAVTDPLGRSADVAELDQDGRRTQILFASDSGAYLGERVLDAGTGAIVSYRLTRTVAVAAALPRIASRLPPDRVPSSPGASTPASDVH